MSILGRFMSSIRVSATSLPLSNNPLLSLMRNPVTVRHGLFKVWVKKLEPIIQGHAPRLRTKFSMHGNRIYNLSSSGRSLCVGSFLGISVVAGAMNFCPNVTHAMDGNNILMEEHQSDTGDPSSFLKEDMDTFLAVARKFQLPAFLLMTVLLGWHYPVTLVINVALLLFCTRPSPFTVYIFVEQLRLRAMRQDPGLYKTKFFYARKVEVQDYKVLCIASVELKDRRLSLIGILGSWWILQSSHT